MWLASKWKDAFDMIVSSSVVSTYYSINQFVCYGQWFVFSFSPDIHLEHLTNNQSRPQACCFFLDGSTYLSTLIVQLKKIWNTSFHLKAYTKLLIFAAEVLIAFSFLIWFYRNGPFFHYVNSKQNEKLEREYLNVDESNAGKAKRGSSCFSSKINSK